MSEPNQKTIETTPGVATVRLGGRVWPVPKLALAQNSVVMPIALRKMELMTRLSEPGAMFDLVTEAHLRDMITVVHQGLLRAHPEMTRAELESMPVDLPDLLDAYVTVTQQSGLFRARKPEDPPPGEATGTSQTGTP